MPKPYQPAIDLIKSILGDPRAFVNGQPQFKSVQDLHSYFQNRGFTLESNTAYGPPDPNARQLIYRGQHNAIVKLKTLGYAGGRRMGQPTMSFEVVRGPGIEWDDALFKVDKNGKIIAKQEMGYYQVTDATKTRLPDGRYALVNPRTGQATPISPFTVLQGKPRDLPITNPQAREAIQRELEVVRLDEWADRGHLDLAKSFERRGARFILTTKVLKILKFTGQSIVSLLVLAAIGLLSSKLEEALKKTILEKQLKDLEPRIREELNKRVQKTQQLLAQGKKAYANISISITTVSPYGPQPYRSGTFGPPPPLIDLVWPNDSTPAVTVTERCINALVGTRPPKFESLGTEVSITEIHTFSVALEIDPDSGTVYIPGPPPPKARPDTMAPPTP